MGTKQEMGASLEELEKAGLVELPAIADAFSGASTALSGISTSGMFIDSGPFSANCPQVPFDDLVDAMVASTRRSGSVLDDRAGQLAPRHRGDQPEPGVRQHGPDHPRRPGLDG